MRVSVLGVQNIALLQREISLLYSNLGYIGARVYIPEQDLRSGKFVLEVVEGIVEEVYWNGSAKEGRGVVATAFPRMVGKPVQLKDIEQGIRQLNRLRSMNVSSELAPGETPGGTNIHLSSVQVGPRISGSVKLNNTNSNPSAELGKELLLRFEGFLGLSEVITYTASYNTQDLWRLSDRPDQNTHAISASIPYGYNLFSLNMERFSYRRARFSQESTGRLTRSVTVLRSL